MKVYRCPICGNIVTKFHDSGVNVVCCGQEMVELDTKLQDGAGEKHVPVVTQTENKIKVLVGEVPHPMEEAHYIEFIILEFEDGFEIKYLNPGEKPEAEFENSRKLVSVYEYCNLHGLWKTTV